MSTTHSTPTVAAAAPGAARPPDRPRSRLATAAIGVTVALWASAFVAIRHVGDAVAPGPLTLGRCAVASFALGVLLLRRGMRRPTGRDWVRLVVCGVLWFALYNVALNAAEQRLDAGRRRCWSTSRRCSSPCWAVCCSRRASRGG